jgi:3-oxoacyl-[acyl-carrier protein] reductase
MWIVAGGGQSFHTTGIYPTIRSPYSLSTGSKRAARAHIPIRGEVVNKPLAGKTALVTGGSRGIGAAIARRLADDGANVAISYSSSDEQASILVHELKELGVQVAAFKADQGDAGQATSLIKAVVEQFGALDILVNNAGVLVYGLVSDAGADLAAIDKAFTVNVRGVAAAVRAAVPLMLDNARIISIGSGVGAQSVWQGMGDYAATKAAVAAYTRSWARDLATRGITVNTVAPGPIETEMNPAVGDFAEMERASVPMGRFGKPFEIAAAVAFLARPDASYITGITLIVDGGIAA